MSNGKDGSAPPRVRARRMPEDGFSAYLRQAIVNQGMTLTDLRQRLAAQGSKVSVSTLSYWRSGDRQPEGAASLEAVGKLEEILQLESGSLRERLGPSRRPGPAAERVNFSDLVALDATSERRIADIDLDDGGDLSAVTVQAVVDVDDQGLVTKVTVRVVLRSLRDGAQRMPLGLRLERPSQESAQFRVVAGGRLGHEVATIAPDLYGSDLILNRPLMVGETTVVEYEMSVPDSRGLNHYEQYLLRRSSDALIWVRFHPTAMPAECVIYHDGGDGEHAVRVNLEGTTDAHHRLSGFGPGVIGIRWSW